MMRHRIPIIVGVFLAILVAGCGATSQGGGQINVIASDVQSQTALQVDYPADGWYEQITVGPRETRAEQLEVARQLAEYAQRHGYPQARVVPNPGAWTECLGQPCLAVGSGPGVFLSILLTSNESLPGPDPTSADTTSEELTSFQDDVLAPRNLQLAKETEAAGLTVEGLRQGEAAPVYAEELYSGVFYLEFSVFNGQPWDLTDPAPETPQQ